jgi:hypothetical protein
MESKERQTMERGIRVAIVALVAGLLFRCEPVEIGGEKPLPIDTTTYACSGKTQCTEMKTCGEANYYLKNCPNVQIDGDLDGIPCEEQLCGH